MKRRFDEVFSEFPEEIFSEMESPTWESHNTALGSYQTITPAILHLIHPYLVIMSFYYVHTLFPVNCCKNKYVLNFRLVGSALQNMQ